ncbi:hypothetical protein ARAM_005354 [Aspergillus rambellii]|uniref:C2H2-type domain-containing protein n=2 Tax=Aspergillus subgen. Nidulantes TaxID=2720870 RepID=A0A0F8WVS6_9EURO|nr:hypothetical protein ARAM_005354 [Aspergillus rambellii]
MLSQSPPQPTASSSRRLSVGAKSRICIHCGRSFRRTEHLERHIRTHTKEKPYTCFCGAAFSRRDLLKRHTGITHQDTITPNTSTTSSLVSPKSQSDQDVVKHPRRRPSTQTRQYHAPPDPPQEIALPPSPGVQWTMQQSSYLGHDQSMLNSTAPNGGITHDAEILEAAQLLLPVGSLPVIYPDPEPSHSLGLPSEWVPAGEVPQVHSAIPEVPEPGHNLSFRDQDHKSYRRNPMDRSRADSPFRSWPPSVPPGDQSMGMVSDYEPPQNAQKALPLKVNEEETLRLAASLEEFRHIIPDFVLPSRHTLTRYLTSFFDGFYHHLPFVHIPTFQINERAPELVLAFLTVGAQYRFEHRNAKRLFHAAKAIVLYRLSKGSYSTPAAAYNTTTQISLDAVREMSQLPPDQSPPMLSPELAAGVNAWKRIETIRALLALMGYATWEGAELVQEALGLQGLMVRSLREFGLTESFSVTSTHPPQQWHEWAEEESIRRTLLLSFCYVHIHSIAYNIYPVLRSSEVHLRLPCSTKEWKAGSAEEWETAQKEVGSPQLFFQDALAHLLQPPRSSSVLLDPIPTPVGNYILLHGLLQRIHLVSELSISKGNQPLALPIEELNKLERALHSWTSVWQQAPESSLDQGNENGPLPFTSSALLGLAYVRLSLNLGPYRHLETRDPMTIASALHRAPKLEPTSYLTPALLYSAHALSIPVRLGIDHIARSQAFFWSVQHSVASLDCAVLLSKWLMSLKDDQNLTENKENESRILYWTRCIVQEAYTSMDLDASDSFPGIEPGSGIATGTAINLETRSLGFAVIKLWARLFRKNTQWPFINVLGESLERYLESVMD